MKVFSSMFWNLHGNVRHVKLKYNAPRGIMRGPEPLIKHILTLTGTLYESLDGCV